MRKIIQFHVYKDDKYYVAEGVGVSLATQGETLDEVVANIRDATDLLLEGEDLASLGLLPSPVILANIELPTRL